MYEVARIVPRTIDRKPVDGNEMGIKASSAFESLFP
jgi:hypothetical protein